MSSTYPVMYRQHIHYLSSSDARQQFIANPLIFLDADAPRLPVSIRLAVVGPPNSGKTTGKYSILNCKYAYTLMDKSIVVM